jgi:alpha/beta superfamily hydrolase
LLIEPLELVVDGFKVRGTLCLPEKSKSVVFTVLHGLPSTPEPVEQKGYLDLASLFTEQGVAAALLNLRGTGTSEGYFSLSNWAEDTEACLRYLSSKLEGYKQFLIGSSAGGVVAIYVAANNPNIKGVVSCSAPYTINPSVARLLLKSALSSGVIRGNGGSDFIERVILESSNYVPQKWVRALAPRPILIAHGRLDELVPVEEAYRLYKAAGEPKKLLLFDAGHRLRANPADMRKIICEALAFFNP